MEVSFIIITFIALIYIYLIFAVTTTIRNGELRGQLGVLQWSGGRGRGKDGQLVIVCCWLLIVYPDFDDNGYDQAAEEPLIPLASEDSDLGDGGDFESFSGFRNIWVLVWIVFLLKDNALHCNGTWDLQAMISGDVIYIYLYLTWKLSLLLNPPQAQKRKKRTWPASLAIASKPRSWWWQREDLIINNVD